MTSPTHTSGVARALIAVCPHHGPFVVTDDDLGCPEQVDYDGITCGHRDPEPRWFVPEVDGA